MKPFFRLLRKTMLYTLTAVLLLTAAVAAYLSFHPVFGGKPDSASWRRIQASPHFNGKEFVNLEPAAPSTQAKNTPLLLYWLIGYVFPPEGKLPEKPLPNMPFHQNTLHNGQFVWLGHSSALMRLNNTTIATDPVFYRASPIALGGKPFPLQHPITTADMPEIDVALLSHDHYDHLDYRAIRELDPKIKHYLVPLGVKAHLQRWGVADAKITELDWDEHSHLNGIRFTLTTSRHASGRSLTNRNSTLWGSWVVQSPQQTVFFSGDGGYGSHFKKIGQTYGPMDLAFIEDGGYNVRWANIHMMPEQSAQAAADVGAKIVVPIHWAKFDLSNHTWKEPIQRFLRAAQGKPFQVATPKIGQVFDTENLPQEKWWETVSDH